MGKGSTNNTPVKEEEIKEPDPIAPVAPTAKSSEEVLMAGKEEKERIRKSFSHSKTVFSRLRNSENAQNDTLG